MNKTVLVTGSSRGIGLALAGRFAENGFNTVLNCRNDVEGMNAAVAALKQLTANVLGIRADVSNYKEADRMLNEISNIFGGVDILINNAGVSYVGLFQDMQPGEWEEILRVNLFAVMNCSSLAIPYMLKNKSGSIINISSIWGEIGASCEAAYSASKGAVNAFTRALAKELGPSGIRVNAISCGVIDTEMNGFLKADELQDLVDNIPVGRIGTAGDIAGLAYYLASDAASYVTGQVLRVDGGML